MPTMSLTACSVCLSVVATTVHTSIAGTTTTTMSIKADSGGTRAALSPDWPKTYRGVAELGYQGSFFVRA